MKKLFLSIALISASALASNTCSAQDAKGESVADIGLGYSLFSNPSNLTSSSQTGYHTTPVINVTYDYAIVNRFSYGISGCYQGFTEFNSTSFYQSNGTYVNENYTVNITVFNVGIRALYHFGSADLDGYTGIRVGYSFWNETDNYINYNNNNNYYNNPNPGQGYPKSVPTFSAIIGLRAKVSDLVGIHIELGLGSPYAVETGISFSLSGGTPASGNSYVAPTPAAPAK